MKTISKILNKEFDFVVNHLGLFLTDELRIVDKYIIIINNQDFEYSCGIGHRESINPLKINKERFNKVINKNPKKDKANLYLYIDELKAVSKPKPLNIDDVLHCLILDTESGNYSFDDFCNNFGYNNDSIKALEIYKACQKNGKKVKTFITDIDKAQELFQDY